jgi:plasmid maintenance system antidote protein VapI
MKSNKYETNTLAIERGKRLRDVINKHFGSQKKLADFVGLSANTINDYVQGRRCIGNDYAVKLEIKAGISSEYLLDGTGQMLNSKFSIHKLTTYLLTVSGITEEIFETEKIDLLKFLTNGLTNPVIVLVTAQQFCINNCIKYNSLLIIDKDNYKDKDVILALIDGKYRLLKQNKKYFYDDILTNESINITNESINIKKIEVLGKVVYKIEDYHI